MAGRRSLEAGNFEETQMFPPDGLSAIELVWYRNKTYIPLIVELQCLLLIDSFEANLADEAKKLPRTPFAVVFTLGHKSAEGYLIGFQKHSHWQSLPGLHTAPRKA